jgi:transposase-like protein
MQIRFERNRTSTIVIMYSLYLYFLGLSLRKTSRALVIFKDENKRSYVSVWNGIQRFGSCQVYKRKLVSAFIIDEIVIQNGNQHFWLWICIELVHSLCLESTFQRREICLLLKDSFDLFYPNMVKILYIQMEVTGIQKHVTYGD